MRLEPTMRRLNITFKSNRVTLMDEWMDWQIDSCMDKQLDQWMDRWLYLSLGS